MGPRPELEKQLTVSAFVLGEDRSLLLVAHKKLGVWLYPGGHVDPAETPDDAVVREVKEETGLDVELLGPDSTSLSFPQADVWGLHTPYKVLLEHVDDPRGEHYHIDLIYLCGVVGGVLQHNAEVTEAGFFTREATLQLDLLPSFRELLDHVYADESAWTRRKDPVMR
jgi:ADP-ribose pyrophosphatase YjhB (NUDIX family)